MCDLLWADPKVLPGRAPSKRGVSCMFGPDVTKRFLDANGLTLLVRSHEVPETRTHPHPFAPFALGHARVHVAMHTHTPTVRARRFVRSLRSLVWGLNPP